MNVEEKLSANTAAVIVNTGDQILCAVGILTDATLEMQTQEIWPAYSSDVEYWLDLRMKVTRGDIHSIVDYASEAAPVQDSIEEATDDRLDDGDDTKRLPGHD